MRDYTIHNAVIYNDPYVVNCLIEDGVDINEKDENGYSPLEYALRYGHMDMVDMLLENGANVTPVTKIQSQVRGFLIRKKYRIQELKKGEMESYPVFVVGNDPVMPAKLETYHQEKDKVALIGTSGLRSISLACKIGNNKNIPKIILVDNSKEVYQFWYAMREFMRDDKLASTKDLFLNNLAAFLKKNSHLYRDIRDDAYSANAIKGVKYLNQNIKTYLTSLIKKYDYDYVRAVVLHTSLIKQSWADENTFIKVKNILNYLGIDKIYMYPSNIVVCVGDASIENQILKNIEKLNPVLSIHTDYCYVHDQPEKVYLFENQNPMKVKNTIFSSNCKPSGFSSNMLDINDLFDTILLSSILQSVNNKSNLTKNFKKVSFLGANMGGVMNAQGFDGTYGPGQAKNILESQGLLKIAAKPQPSVALEDVRPLFLALVKTAVADYQLSLAIDENYNEYIRDECSIDCKNINIAIKVQTLLKDVGFTEVSMAPSSPRLLQGERCRVTVQIPKTVEKLVEIATYIGGSGAMERKRHVSHFSNF